MERRKDNEEGGRKPSRSEREMLMEGKGRREVKVGKKVLNK